jgi:hypothetical protein
MTRLTSLFLLLTLGQILGCARHAPKGGVDFVIPRGCLTADPMLLGCNSSQSPPACKHAKLNYQKGCEVLVVRK